MSKLAILGGTPVRSHLFPISNSIGEEEKTEVLKVMDSANLSQFIGAWHPDFYGGPSVKSFEKLWADTFNVTYAISVNSNTSGLIAAVGACGLQPGDEVILPPYTMSATAMAAMFYGAVPVFADVSCTDFCLNPKSIEANITPRTKAIIVVHLFGHPAPMDEIMQIANQYGLWVIEDCAQAPLARYKNRWVGTIGHIGVFSLNYHKHIHCGEGGMLITNQELLAEKIQLIRNHGENVVEAKGTIDLTNTYGFNFRMTEIEAAIGRVQLKKLPQLLKQRIENVEYLNTRLADLPFVAIAQTKADCNPVYYVQALTFNAEGMGLHRNVFVNALKAELPSAYLRETTPLISSGYVKPLYLQPLYQKRAVACSFNCGRYAGTVSYDKGICPSAEDLHENILFTHELMRPGMLREDLDDVIDAFYKVYENRIDLL
jgi:dTDP-4-amino-4,6-dideoxygalactose transaminase